MNWFKKQKKGEKEVEKRIHNWLTFRGLLRIIHRWGYPTEILVTLDEFEEVTWIVKKEDIKMSTNGPYIDIGPTRVIAYEKSHEENVIIDLRHDGTHLADLENDLYRR